MHSLKGTIFSIEEFAVYDGSGIRVNVFFKGCPLRCQWCHNPEGWLPTQQIVHSPNGCLYCGQCTAVCPSPDQCIGCGACILACPRRLIRFSGEQWESTELAERILRLKDILIASEGGVTFSGGEVLMQPEFLCELLDKTAELNRAIETSGYAEPTVFKQVLERVDFVFYDLKVMDPLRHQHYTGKDNSLILNNARILMDSGVPYVFRVPYIHGVNTDEDNLIALREFLRQAPTKPSVEFLPYNQLAGAKYKMFGWEYQRDFQRPTEEDVQLAKRILGDFTVKISR